MRYDGPAGGYDEGSAIAVDAAGDAYVAGVSDGGESGPDVVVLKIAGATGDVLWETRHDATLAAGERCDAERGCGADRARAITVLDDGGVAVVASSRRRGRDDSDYLTLRVASTGEIDWSARADGPAHGEDVPGAVAADRCGNVYVTGRSDGGASQSALTIAYDWSGAERWRHRFDGPGEQFDEGEWVALDAAGGIYVAGTSHGGDGRPQAVVLAYDGRGGERWRIRHEAPAGLSQHLAGAAADGAGNVYIAGSVGNVDGWRYLVARYGSDGALAWDATYAAGPAGTDSVARAMAVDAGGDVYVTGEVAIERRRRCEVCADYGTAAFDGASGALRWAERLDGSGGHRDRAHAIAVGAGAITVTGRSVSAGSRDLGFGQPPRDIVTARYAQPGATPAPRPGSCAP